MADRHSVSAAERQRRRSDRLSYLSRDQRRRFELLRRYSTR
jgi:hypothetical protein